MEYYNTAAELEILENPPKQKHKKITPYSAHVSCIIPFYNEGPRLLTVLNILSNIQSLREIICVDDGSSDQIGDIIKKNHPAVTLITLSENQGKTAAIRHGLKQAKYDTVLLIDADLSGINQKEIENSLKAMYQFPELDMIILRRVNAPWFVKMNRSDILLSGERIIRKAELINILLDPIEGYQLEVAINKYMQKNDKKVHWMPSSATNIPKMKKIGFWEGLLKEIYMFTNIVLYLGFFTSIKQMLSFCNKKLEMNL